MVDALTPEKRTPPRPVDEALQLHITREDATATVLGTTAPRYSVPTTCYPDGCTRVLRPPVLRTRSSDGIRKKKSMECVPGRGRCKRWQQTSQKRLGPFRSFEVSCAFPPFALASAHACRARRPQSVLCMPPLGRTCSAHCAARALSPSTDPLRSPADIPHALHDARAASGPFHCCMPIIKYLFNEGRLLARGHPAQRAVRQRPGEQEECRGQ